MDYQFNKGIGPGLATMNLSLWEKRNGKQSTLGKKTALLSGAPLEPQQGTALPRQMGYILLMFGSGFFTDVPGEALGTLAGPPRPWVLGEPEGPLAGDS